MYLLALRILCICFEQRLGKEWPRIVRVMRDLGRRNEAAPELWSFMEFVVTHRTPLYICLMPFILHKVIKLLFIIIHSVYENVQINFISISRYLNHQSVIMNDICNF